MSISPDTLQDTELFQRLAKGDEPSLSELHRRYAGPLRATALRILNNSRDADEVVQETFVQMWEKAAVYDSGRGKPFSWAVTLTRNKAIDRLRGLQRRARLHDEIERETNIATQILGTDSADEAAAHETCAIVRSAVIQLSKDQRHAIELAFFTGLTQREIARQLGQPLGTVKARIRRGMMKLRQALDPTLFK